MGLNSNIEWCHNTWSPWLGCRKVSEGCANCYITRTTPFRVRKIEHGARRDELSAAYWRQPIAWNKAAEKLGVRYRIFPSLCDWLDDEVPLTWLARFLDLVRVTPALDWLLLTKRPENWMKRIDGLSVLITFDEASYQPDLVRFLCRWKEGQAPPNVWVGASVENQRWADVRIPVLLGIPAAVRFLSCEPLLGPVDLAPWIHWSHSKDEDGIKDSQAETGIDWVIVGGESGTVEENPRAMHPSWARTLRDQCMAAEVPFFFKQWGEWGWDGNDRPIHMGKKQAGRALDGRLHDEFPVRRDLLPASKNDGKNDTTR